MLWHVDLCLNSTWLLGRILISDSLCFHVKGLPQSYTGGLSPQPDSVLPMEAAASEVACPQEAWNPYSLLSLVGPEGKPEIWEFRSGQKNLLAKPFSSTSQPSLPNQLLSVMKLIFSSLCVWLLSQTKGSELRKRVGKGGVSYWLPQTPTVAVLRISYQ